MASHLLPIPRRRSRATRLARTGAKAWTSMKVDSVGARAARRGMKAYGAFKLTSLFGRGVPRMLALPAAMTAAALLWRKLRPAPEPEPAERPLGPVSTPQAVSPPAPKRDDVLDDEPAGAVNPPVGAAKQESS